MVYKIWILLTFLAGTFALPDPESEESAFDYDSPSWRIHGGTPAGIVPYMVALTNGQQVRAFFCGASLVTPQTVLTAAHCIDAASTNGFLSRSVLATVGTTRWSVGGQAHNIARSIYHPNFSRNILKNDIGLLITATKVTLSNSVRTVPLHFDFVGPNVLTKVTGWGRTESGAISDILQQLTTTTIDGRRCGALMAEMGRKRHKSALPVQPEIELCTLQPPQHGACKGDSGSPLVLADQGRQVGIVSWTLGAPPCAVRAPDVYVRISAYKDWLQRNIL